MRRIFAFLWQFMPFSFLVSFSLLFLRIPSCLEIPIHRQRKQRSRKEAEKERYNLGQLDSPLKSTDSGMRHKFSLGNSTWNLVPLPYILLPPYPLLLSAPHIAPCSPNCSRAQFAPRACHGRIVPPPPCCCPLPYLIIDDPQRSFRTIGRIS